VTRQFAHVSRIVWSGVSRKTRVAVIVLHKCVKSDSQIFELLKPLKISSIGQLNVIKNSGVLQTGLGQDARGV
jgi:hypothetical protein